MQHCTHHHAHPGIPGPKTPPPGLDIGALERERSAHSSPVPAPAAYAPAALGFDPPERGSEPALITG
jgi:hypothetical protein